MGESSKPPCKASGAWSCKGVLLAGDANLEYPMLWLVGFHNCGVAETNMRKSVNP